MTGRAQILLVACFLVSSVTHAEIYKWVDDRGNVHYGDKPVDNSQQLEIKTETSDVTAETKDSRDERRRRLLDAMQEDRNEKEKQDADRKKKKKNLNRQCAYAKDRLKRYQQSSGLYDLDKDGNRVLLSDEERKRATDGLRSQIKKHCK
ncbi:MAG: DUF4124 domain-containing protein [Gammaproteobacteria bacterium]|nr:DUF4124 domain-containing protein [Gammaproteobacteria bacterium]